MASFHNDEYRAEWGGDTLAVGTYSQEGNSYAVYDGAGNFMGFVKPNGTFAANGGLTEYKASFLRTAKAELMRRGLVCVVEGVRA